MNGHYATGAKTFLGYDRQEISEGDPFRSGIAKLDNATLAALFLLKKLRGR